MSWVTSYSGKSTLNLGTFDNGRRVLFHLKELLKAVGWTVMSSSDASTYNASGDQITHDSSGADGMDNNNAWFRIQDPGALREYVFQCGTSGQSIKWMYSASDKFTGGTPGVTTVPTATDEQGLAKALDSAQVMFVTKCYFHIAAENTPHNGVYAWWLVGPSPVITTPDYETLMCCDAMDSQYTSDDNDPCVHYGSDDTGAYSTLSGTSMAAQSDSFRGWMRYDEADEEWGGLTAVFPTASAYTLNPVGGLVNPHTGKHIFEPIRFFRHTNTGSIIGVKGITRNIRWKAHASQRYPDVYNDGTDNYLLWFDLALPGFDAGVVPR